MENSILIESQTVPGTIELFCPGVLYSVNNLCKVSCAGYELMALEGTLTGCSQGSKSSLPNAGHKCEMSMLCMEFYPVGRSCAVTGAQAGANERPGVSKSLFADGYRISDDTASRRCAEIVMLAFDFHLMRYLLSLRLTCEANYLWQRFPVHFLVDDCELETQLMESYLVCASSCFMTTSLTNCLIKQMQSKNIKALYMLQK